MSRLAKQRSISVSSVSSSSGNSSSCSGNIAQETLCSVGLQPVTKLVCICEREPECIYVF